jgi:ABC-type nitrate/sulfonate/bicarbonate transport system substrate-binding protein
MKRYQLRGWTAGLAIGAAGALLVGCSSSSTQGSSPSTQGSSPSTQGASASTSLTTITFSAPSIPGDDIMPLYAAVDLGIAAANGIKIQFLPAASGSALVTAVVAGAAEFSQVPLSTAAQAIKQGTAIETLGQAGPQSGGFFLESRVGSGITSVEQLKGKTICDSSSGSETGLMAEYTNVHYKLGATVVAVGSAGKQAALLSGKSDACVMSSPQSYQLIAQNKAVKILDFNVVAPTWGVFIAKNGYAQSHKSQAEALLKSWYQTIAKFKANPALAYQYYEKLDGITQAEAQAEFGSYLKDSPTSGAVTTDMVSSVYSLLQAIGEGNTLPSVDQVATDQFSYVQA